MNSFMSKFLKSSLFSSVGLIIFGLLLIFQSEVTIVSVSYVIGGILVAVGVLALLDYVRGMNKNTKNELDIVYGIGMVVLGIVVISNPKAVASIIPFILGIIIILSSSAKLQYSLELRKKKNDLWRSTMLLSLFSLLCGIFLVFNPFRGAEFITKVVGILLLLYGITDVVSTLRIKKTINVMQNLFEEKVPEADVIEDNTKK